MNPVTCHWHILNSWLGDWKRLWPVCSRRTVIIIDQTYVVFNGPFIRPHYSHSNLDKQSQRTLQTQSKKSFFLGTIITRIANYVSFSHARFTLYKQLFFTTLSVCVPLKCPFICSSGGSLQNRWHISQWPHRINIRAVGKTGWIWLTRSHQADGIAQWIYLTLVWLKRNHSYGLYWGSSWELSCSFR